MGGYKAGPTAGDGWAPIFNIIKEAGWAGKILKEQARWAGGGRIFSLGGS